MMRSLPIAFGFALLTACPVAAEPAPVSRAERGALRPELNEVKNAVYQRSNLSIAQVVRETKDGKEVGSGFFAGEPGQVVTVLPSAEETTSLWINYGAETMRRFEAKVLVSDPYTGLALLSVEGVGEVSMLPLGESASVALGDYLYGVARTEDSKRACTVGRLAGREKWLDGRTLAASVMRLHMDPPVEGFGAPLFDRDASLVGVLLLGEEGDGRGGVSYALPVEHVAKLLRDYKRHGRAATAWLGLGMTMGTSTPEIRSLREGSPAATAGLRVGDVILSIGGRSVADYQDVVDACYVLTAGDAVGFELLRGLEDVAVVVVPVARAEKSDAGAE